MSTPAQPINILVLMNRVPWPLNDGGAIGAYNFVKGYAGAGCNVTMLVMNTTKHFIDEKQAREVLEPFGKVVLVPVDNRIKPFDALLNLLTTNSYIIERFVSEDFENKLLDLLSAHKFEVVHIDGLPPAAYLESVYNSGHVITSMRAHNVEHVIWERIAAQEKNAFKKWYVTIQAKRLKEFEMKAIKKCEVIMAISREDEITLKRCYHDANTIIVPAGMDISDKPENDNYNVADLFFIGSFDWMPNLQGMDWFAKQVWPSLSARFPQLKIAVAGKKMPEEIYSLKSESFNPVGETPDAKQFMLQHGVMIVPIVSGSGIRIKILEGMALGKTIIATTIAAEGLGLTNGKNILIADTAEEFIGHIGKCLSDEAFCKNIGLNAHRFALEHYRNKNIFEKLVGYYREMLHSRRSK